MALLSDDEVKLRISADTTGGAAVDQLANAVIGGWADETFSGRAWRI